MKHYGLLTLLGLALVGCSNQSFQDVTVYSCQSHNGSNSNIEIHREKGDKDHITIMFGDEPTKFSRIPSASGEKYVEIGDEDFIFWTKGQDATFIYANNETGSCELVN